MASTAQLVISVERWISYATPSTPLKVTVADVPGGTTATFQGGVMRGPLYNGQDYLGDDPDPNVRAFLLKNLSGRYGSSY